MTAEESGSLGGGEPFGSDATPAAFMGWANYVQVPKTAPPSLRPRLQY